MSAHSKNKKEPLPFVISYKFLLGLYLILPICILVQLIDHHYFEYFLRKELGYTPQKYFIFQILFGTPHIIASNVLILSNKEYFQFYKKRFLGASLFIIVFFAIGNYVLSYITLYIIVAALTILHVIKQQFGLANSLCRLSGWVYFLWHWTGIFLSIIIYNSIFLGGIFEPELSFVLKRVFFALSLFFIGLSLLCHFKIKTALGKLFFWSNTLLVLGVYYLYTCEYFFFAILAPRVIHDVTAFMFYISHDYNRHQEKPQNLLYKIVYKLKFKIVLIPPLIAIVSTYLLEFQGDYYFNLLTTSLFNLDVPKAMTLGVVGYFSIMHYYTESFTWKNDSPYRQFIQLKN